MTVGTTITETHVIVGASVAGAEAAETLRTEGFDGRIVLFGEELQQEPAHPEGGWSRPPDVPS